MMGQHPDMHDVTAGTEKQGARRIAATSPLVFIHSAHRASSTWFWSKFRELPSTYCFYEPFNFTLQWITTEKASWLSGDTWESRHAATGPYYREYAPLIRGKHGVELFDPSMTMKWFIPHDGLRGGLRQSEIDYLSGLVRLSEEFGKTPVFGDCWSLGRARAIKQKFGGYHILQFRNLWLQWLSHLWYKQVTGSRTFYCSIFDTIFRDSDPYFKYLVEHGLKLAADPRTGKDPKASSLRWNRSYVNFSRDDDKVRQLELLPEPRTFALFMGMRLYLYLHAQLFADLTADATRMARDSRYRTDLERAIQVETGLSVSFADAADLGRPNGVEFDHQSVDWEEIREHARMAAQMLSEYGAPADLAANATILVEETMEEMRRDTSRSVTVTIPSSPATSTSLDASEATIAAEGRDKTIGLCMIVKNETKVIRRCLESVLPLVDYVLVVDTGSMDGTQQMIRDFLTEHQTKGDVIDEPWRDFAYSRNFALAKLREIKGVDYALIIDADDALELDPGFDPRAFKAQMSADLYDLPVRHGHVVHHRAQLFRNQLPFSFKGVVHEYLEAPSGHLKRETITEFAVRASTGGARNENPRKYQDDAAVLERALATETDLFLISRYTFYLAQSYRDCNEREKALANYLKRAELGFWNEEIYVSLVEAGNIMATLGKPFDEVTSAYERAAQTVPTRAEALHAASRYCRDKGKNAEGMEFARRGINLIQPNGLFVQSWIYDYGILDEFAINAYWAGAFSELLDASLKLLASDKLPSSMIKRVAANAKFATEKLPAAKPLNLGRLGAEDLIKQHTLVPQRSLHSRVKHSPRVLVAILAKQKENALPLFLDCIEGLDYPKSSIVLYVRTNNNTDRTERILRDWVARVGHLYHSVEFEAGDVSERVERFSEHEWNAARFKVLGAIRNQSMRRAQDLGCEYYFVADVDNFVRPATLRELVALDLPIASPLLRSIDPARFYSNYHAEIDANGYYMSCEQYIWLLERRVRGVVEVPVVHCTYLVRADVIPQLTYEDDSGRHEYVIFSDSARKAGIPQYLDNRQVYGYVTFGEGGEHYVSGGIQRARTLLRSADDKAGIAATLPQLPAPAVTITGPNGDHPLAIHVKHAFDEAMADRGKLDKRILAFPGASGRKYRLFINTLVGLLDDARYLEIGSFTGSTLCTAIVDNKVKALVIDNWSQFGGPVKEFMHNVAEFRGSGAIISILERDFRGVDYAHIGKFNVYMFDGPHTERDHYDAVNLALPALDDHFLLIVDDWDWGQVRSGTEQAISDNGLTKKLWIEVRTTMDGTTPAIGHQQSDWHNGYLIAVMSKQVLTS